MYILSQNEKEKIGRGQNCSREEHEFVQIKKKTIDISVHTCRVQSTKSQSHDHMKKLTFSLIIK